MENQEEWVFLSGFNGLYEISNYGRVKSLQHAYQTGLKKPTKKTYHHNIIKVINNETGEIYDSLMEASVSSGLKYHAFFYRLKNNNYKYQKINN